MAKSSFHRVSRMGRSSLPASKMGSDAEHLQSGEPSAGRRSAQQQAEGASSSRSSAGFSARDGRLRSKGKSRSGEFFSRTLHQHENMADPKSHLERLRRFKESLRRESGIPQDVHQGRAQSGRSGRQHYPPRPPNRDSVRKNLLKKRLAESKIYAMEEESPPAPPVKSEVAPKLLGQIDAAITSCDDTEMDAARARVKLAFWKVVQAQQAIDALKIREASAKKLLKKKKKQMDKVQKQEVEKEKQRGDQQPDKLGFFKKIPRTLKSIPHAYRDSAFGVTRFMSWLTKVMPEGDSTSAQSGKSGTVDGASDEQLLQNGRKV